MTFKCISTLIIVRPFTKFKVTLLIIFSRFGEWKRMNERMRYTALSRTTKKELINIAEEKEELDITMEGDVNLDNLKKNQQRRRQLADPLRRKRFNAMTVLYRIIKGCSSDAYSFEQTGLSRADLLNHLKIPNGEIPYQIDHIRERHTFVTDADFKVINHFSNLRLLQHLEEQKRHSLISLNQNKISEFKSFPFPNANKTLGEI